MLIVTLSFKFQESWYIVNQQCQFSARAAILAMMEPCLEVGDLLQEFLHVLGVPEETSAWIFYGEEDSMLMAKSAQLLSHLVQAVGSLNSRLQVRAKIWKLVWTRVGSQHWRIVLESPLDEPCS